MLYTTDARRRRIHVYHAPLCMLMLRRIKWIAELVRYGIAGVVNSIIGYAIFFVAFRIIGLSPQISNALGYCIGLSVTFAINRYFVFDGARFNVQSALRFIVCFAVAFALNQGSLVLLIESGFAKPEMAQVFAMSLYTVAFYLMNKHIVWSTKRSD